MWKIRDIRCLGGTEHKRNSEWSKKSEQWNVPLKPNLDGLCQLLIPIYFSVSFNRNKDRKIWAYWGRNAYSGEHQNSFKNLTNPFITKIRMMSSGSVGWSLRSGVLSNVQKQYFELKVINLHGTPSSDSLPMSLWAEQLHLLISGSWLLFSCLPCRQQQRFSQFTLHLAKLVISVRVFALECNKNN